MPLATLLFKCVSLQSSDHSWRLNCHDSYSVVFHIKAVDQDTGILVLDLLSEVRSTPFGYYAMLRFSKVLVHPAADGEAHYRALVAAGNVVSIIQYKRYSISETNLPVASQMSSKSRPKVGKKGVELLKQTTALGKKTTESRTKELVKEVQSVIV